jgi:hypothetical protein
MCWLIDERDYPTLFGTTKVTWAPIDVRFLPLTGEINPALIARVDGLVDPDLVGQPGRPGPLWDLGVGVGRHWFSLRPHLHGGHRWHGSGGPLSPSTHLFQ